VIRPQFVEPIGLLLGPTGDEQGGKELAESRVLLAPADAHQRQHGGILLLLGCGAGALVPTQRVAAVEDEVGHPLGVAHRVGDGDRTPLGDPEQREPRDPRGVDYRLQIAHEGVERDLVGGPVRQPVAAGVVPDELMVLRQLPIRCRQMGLSRSNSRWVIQLPVFINGGPWPIIE